MNNNISYIRVYAVLGILLHHCICAFYGCFGKISVGSVLPMIFSDGTDIVRRVSLASFTFISGYVLYYQAQKKETFGNFILKKIKRLLFPCFFYVLVYLLLFPQFVNAEGPINGTHLWYLPMLFVCILLVSSHFYIRYAPLYILTIYLAFKILSRGSIMIRFLDATIIYLPVFYVGFMFNKLNLEQRLSSLRQVWLGLILITLWLLLLVFDVTHTDIVQMCLIPVGLYLVVAGFNKNKVLNVFNTIIAKQAFAIYLLHQFVILIMLGYVDLSHVSPYITLVLYFFLSLFVSLIASEVYDRIFVFRFDKTNK